MGSIPARINALEARLRLEPRDDGPIVVKLKSLKPGHMVRLTDRGLLELCRNCPPGEESARGVLASYILQRAMTTALRLGIQPSQDGPDERILAAARAAALEMDAAVIEAQLIGHDGPIDALFESAAADEAAREQQETHRRANATQD